MKAPPPNRAHGAGSLHPFKILGKIEIKYLTIAEVVFSRNGIRGNWENSILSGAQLCYPSPVSCSFGPPAVSILAKQSAAGQAVRNLSTPAIRTALAKASERKLRD